VGLAVDADGNLYIADSRWEKPIEEWSAADLKRILSDSPWARSATAHVRGYVKNSEKFRPNDSFPRPNRCE